MKKLIKYTTIFFMTLFPLKSFGLPPIVAIGDLHGDYSQALKLLKKAEIIDDQSRWIGGDTILVQLGDQIDRGAGDKQIIDLFEHLKNEAPKFGGMVHSLIGNHEAMNVDGNFKYVFPDKAFYDFEDFSSTAPKNYVVKYSAYQQGRFHAFFPGGHYAKILSNRKAILKLGPYIFVHGGVVPKYAKLGIDQLNQQISYWMKGITKRPSWISDSKGPLWARYYSKKTNSSHCKMLKKSLKILKAKIMFVAHTVQRNGINTACDGRVVRTDTGISSYYGGKKQAVRIQNGELSIIN
ncbi:metallophosphoesterase [Bacteriovoracales bacterium]|nr:metallophosphoesterase [Bacteriovoracales bacterium]